MKYLYTRFYNSEFFREQFKLEQRMGLLPWHMKLTPKERRRWEGAARTQGIISAGELTRIQLAELQDRFKQMAIQVTLSVAPALAAFEQLSAAVDKFGPIFEKTPASRRSDKSDWLYQVIYDNRLETSTRFWWVGFYPSLAFEYVVLQLPLSWFEE